MDVNTIRAQILQKDERNGYIERERAIDDFLRAGGGELTQAERYVRALEQVLAALSTPVHPDDLLVGRMVEGPLPYELEPVPAGGKSHVHNPFKPTGRSAGHMSLDYTALLRKGLTGIAQEFAVNAHTPAQQAYAGLVDRAVQAIGSYAARRQMGRPRRDGLHRQTHPHSQLLLALLPPDAGLAPRRTPDGRLAGQDVSVNQSPVYGCDTTGATALLRSVASLPQSLCGAGGLNLRLARPLADDQLAALVSAFFSMSGVNVAPNVLSRETLLAAREHPEQYQNLAVRIVGYSELYLRLPEHMQQEILNRTEQSL